MTVSTSTQSCFFCDRPLGTTVDGDACLVNGNHWTGSEWIRVDLCMGCYSAGRLAKRPRQPRPQPVYAATDWNMLVSFNQRGRRQRG